MSVRVFRFADRAVVYVGVAFFAAGIAGCRLVPLDPGDEVVVDCGPLGQVSATVA